MYVADRRADRTLVELRMKLCSQCHVSAFYPESHLGQSRSVGQQRRLTHCSPMLGEGKVEDYEVHFFSGSTNIEIILPCEVTTDHN